MDGAALLLAAVAAAFPLMAGYRVLAATDPLPPLLQLARQPLAIGHWVAMGVALFGLVFFGFRGLFRPVGALGLSVSLGLFLVSAALGAAAAATAIPSWASDPRVLTSVLVLIAFSAAFALRSRPKAARPAFIAGLALLVLLAIMVRSVPTGFHVFAVLP